MREWQRMVKRSIDLAAALVGLTFLGPLILVIAAIARWDTGKGGFFQQRRVGLHGKLFFVIKIRTMRDIQGMTTTATTAADPRITPFGRFLRRYKLDELPQLWNVLMGDMSLVGPRPDVPDLLATISESERQELLAVRPGITGPATLRYRHEEQLLAQQSNPDQFNTDVIFPDKVRINRHYVRNYRIQDDLLYLWWTVFPPAAPRLPFASTTETAQASMGRRAA
jgi:lipopolysaccharide/colanic/teichoic acid biosynthesis glycosyltransferase